MEISARRHAHFATTLQPSGRASDALAHHIALVMHSLGGGGAQRRVATLANAFAQAGRRVDVVTLDARGPVAALLDPALRVVPLARHKPLKGMLTVAHAPALARYLAEARPDVVMSAATNTHALTVAAAALVGDAPRVVLRASRHPLRQIGWRWPVRHLVETLRRAAAARSYRRADAIVAVSRGVESGLGTLLGDASRVTTILNPVICADFEASHDPLPGLEEPLIVAVGRMVRQKDFATLIAAFASLRRTHSARLALLGAGPDRPRLLAQARRLGIADDVMMPGEVNDVPAWLCRAAMLVSSSLWEGLPATLIEALAAGCPVVATDCPGGSREILDDGRFGALVPMQDARAMAEAMRSMLDTPPDRERLREGAAPYVAGDQALRYLDLFDRCMGEGPPASMPAAPAMAQAAE